MCRNSPIDPYYTSAEWKALRLTIFIRDGKICRYCGRKADQVDHIMPRKKGGKDHPDNLVCCCARCNELAGGRPFSSFTAKQAWILAKIHEVEQIVTATPDGAKVTICNGSIPDRGGYQHWGMSTKKRRAKWGRRKSIRKKT